jgi:hypothetical protein
MSRSVSLWALAAGILAGGAGCFNADVRVPDVQVNTSDYGGRSSNERRMPYARELEKVLDQQKAVDKKLKKRDWADLNDELVDWIKYARKLTGKADTSKNPARMRDYCSQLIKEIEAMQKAGRAHDATGAQAAFSRTDPWLNRLSSEFPLAEPIPEAQRTPPPSGNRPSAP